MEIKWISWNWDYREFKIKTPTPPLERDFTLLNDQDTGEDGSEGNFTEADEIDEDEEDIDDLNLTNKSDIL